MVIMKYFIKRKNKENKSLFSLRSALSIVLAFAAFSMWGAEPKTAEKGSDSNSSEEFTARSVFEKINTQALELLTPTMRLDMLDYWDADSVYKVSNVMEGLSWLEEVTDSYLKVHITDVSALEIKILPVKKGKIAMTVYTVGSDMQSSDSQLDFYDQNLQILNSKDYFDIPDLKDFVEIPKGSLTSMKEIREMIPFPTIAYEASSENNDLKAFLTVKDYINQDDWNILKLFLKPYITFEWKKDKYRK